MITHQLKDITLINGDCVEYMKTLPDKAFDLAIVDPPYGDGMCGGGENRPPALIKQDNGEDSVRDSRGTKNRLNHAYGGRFQRYQTMQMQWGGQKNVSRTGGTWATRYGAGVTGRSIVDWDYAPTEEYFEQLFRVSKNQIIWGANYFEMPPTRCFVIWEKLTISEKFSMAMAEYAWTSFNENAKIFKHAPQGDKEDKRFHPTQKPIALYEWLLHKYAKEGDTILDTHGGSMSSMIACHRLGFKATCIEIDEFYFGKAVDRIKREQSQLTLF